MSKVLRTRPILTVSILMETALKSAVTLAHLALSISPKIGHQANQIIQRRIGRLVHKHTAQADQWQPHQSQLHALMYRRASHEFERPFVDDHKDAEDKIYDL